MKAPADTATWLSRIVGDSVSRARGGLPAWRRQQQGAAAHELRRKGLPGRKQEAWRYTSLDFLERNRFVSAEDLPFDALVPEDIEEFLLPGDATQLLVFVNGRYAPDLSNPPSHPAGVHVSSLRQMLETDGKSLSAVLGSTMAEHVDAFSAMNLALFTDGCYLRVDPGVHPERPLEILHLAVWQETPVMFHPRNLILIGEGARATLVERYASLGRAASFTNTVTEIRLEEGAGLTHERLHEEAPTAHHLSRISVHQNGDSRYQVTTAAVGPAWSRTDLHVELAGREAEADLGGVYLAGDGQLADVHTDLRHAVPGCTSREDFKGILDGKGRAVFDGRILVARDAQHSDAQMKNDNLLLSRKAEVDTKPQLEIFADDVRCSHGTTVGQLDENMLFYLRSRGIDEARARQLLCLGFAGGILERFRVPGVRERVNARIAGRLGEYPAPDASPAAESAGGTP
ncbi:MAG: Fe-S cluster assembly protein SufD [Pseudomonadota bacterium]